MKTGFSVGISAVSSLTPTNVKWAFNTAVSTIRSMTVAQLIWSGCKVGFNTSFSVALFVFFLLATVARFFFFMMTGSKDEEERVAALPMPDHGAFHKYD